MENNRLVKLVRQAPALKALREGPLDRRDLERELDVSKPTVHRLTRWLYEEGLAEKAEGAVVLTGQGKAVAKALAAFGEHVETTRKLAPVLEAIHEHDIDFDVTVFADVTVTHARPGNPYRGVDRFMSLIKETEMLRGIDPTSINPLHIDEIHVRILDGMETDVIFPRAIADELFASNPEQASEAFESGNLTIRTHDDLSFGLMLCDARIGIGIYDDAIGMLRTFVDTDAPEAREWAETVYESYLVDAECFDWSIEQSQYL